jgi:hypothetical protein
MQPVFEPAGPGQWRPSAVARGPFAGLHGGAVTGLLCAEMEAEAQRRDAGVPVSVTAHMLRPAPEAVLTTEMVTVHSGQRVTVLENRATVGGKVLTVARACFVATAETPSAPDLPRCPRRVDDLPEWTRPSPRGGPWFMDTMSVRFGHGIHWFRIHRPIVRPLTDLARVVCVADWAHGLSRPDSPQSPAVRAFPNPELTVHLIRPAEGDWVGVEATTRWRKDGLGCGRAVLWDECGEIGTVAMAIVLVPFDTGLE